MHDYFEGGRSLARLVGEAVTYPALHRLLCLRRGRWPRLVRRAARMTESPLLATRALSLWDDADASGRDNFQRRSVLACIRSATERKWITRDYL